MPKYASPGEYTPKQVITFVRELFPDRRYNFCHLHYLKGLVQPSGKSIVRGRQCYTEGDIVAVSWYLEIKHSSKIPACYLLPAMRKIPVWVARGVLKIDSILVSTRRGAGLYDANKPISLTHLGIICPIGRFADYVLQQLHAQNAVLTPPADGLEQSAHSPL